jgi:hypothetical protein
MEVEHDSSKKIKNKVSFPWFRNLNSLKKFGKNNGLHSKDRKDVEFLVLKSFEVQK